MSGVQFKAFQPSVRAKDAAALMFEVHNMDVAFANAMRRVILAEIPNIAIRFEAYNEQKNDIKITHNTTSLHNEYMGHRLSLIPIHLTPDEVDNYSETPYVFKIAVQNKTNHVVKVTTKDIQVYLEDTHMPDMSDALFPVDPITKDYILITKLKPNNYNVQEGEAFEVTFGATMGIAKQHSRWCPVSTCTYENVVDETLAERTLNELLEQKKDVKPEEKSKLLHQFNTLDRQRCFIRNPLNDEACAFKFNIVSECKLTPAYLFTKAFDVLLDKFDALTAEGNMTTHTIHEPQNLFLLQVLNENDTFGNLFQSMAYNMFVNSDDKRLDFIGYNLPHPLETQIVFKVKFSEAVTPEEVPARIKGMCGAMKKHILDIKEAWLESLNGKKEDALKSSEKKSKSRRTVKEK